jgi:multidrug efflux pump subunit AcrA (membrane-fusion protein)
VPRIPQPLLRRPWVRRTLPAGVAAVLVLAGTAVTRANANASPVDTYRTAPVTTGSVEQRLNLTGSVQQVDQVSQGFAVAGNVTSVLVAVGDTVRTGQALATVNPLPLQRALTSAQASLARAEATLESDQTPTTATNSANSTGSTGSTTDVARATPAQTATPTTSPRVASPPGRSGSGTGQSLAQAQKRVVSAQRAILADLGQASAALARCAPFLPSASSAGPSPTTSPTSPVTTTPATSGPPPTGSPTPTSTATAQSTVTPSAAAISACLGAFRSAPTQQQIQRDKQALTRSQTDLMTSVTLAVTTAGNTKAPATATPAAAGQSSASRSSTGQSATRQSATGQAATSQAATTQSLTTRSPGAQSTGGLSAGSGQSSASRVVSDQAAVTTAQDALSGARADLSSATLKSSIAGTVGSVSLVTGASSAGTSIIIVGTGAVAVTVNVPLASMGAVHVGQKANVSPQGTTGSAPGSVTSVSLLPSTSTSTSTSGSSAGRATTQGSGQTATASAGPVYPVVVLVPDALPALASGSRADVSLLIGTAANVLTVPNSALTPLGNGQAVALTFRNGVATRALVKTGYAGMLTTQVTSGLRAGQQVVLADLSTALPTNTTSSRRFGVGGGAGGGLAGGGLGGAGLGGTGGTGGTGGAGFGGGGFTPRG